MWKPERKRSLGLGPATPDLSVDGTGRQFQTFAGEISFLWAAIPWNFLSHVLFRFLLVCLGLFGFLSAGWLGLWIVEGWEECGWKVTMMIVECISELKVTSFLFSSWKCKQPHHFSCLDSEKEGGNGQGLWKATALVLRGFVMENCSLCCYYGSSARM